MTLTFANAPINEVVLGTAFVQRTDFLIPRMGEFWVKHLSKDYPTFAHVLPLESNGELTNVDPATQIPIPRLWFASGDKTRLVQLQQDRLYFNWRRVNDDDRYIRFDAIKQEFLRLFQLFSGFLKSHGEEDLRPTRYELNYVNLIHQGQGWGSYSELGEVLRDFSWRGEERYLPPPARAALKLEFNIPGDHGGLIVSIDPARRLSTGLNLAKMELAAFAPTEVVLRKDIETWAVAAHEFLIRAFKDLTTEKMHTEFWRLEGEAE